MKNYLSIVGPDGNEDVIGYSHIVALRKKEDKVIVVTVPHSYEFVPQDDDFDFDKLKEKVFG